MQNAQRVDAAAISLSGLCVLHCLGLPLVASFLPVISQAAEAEWIHKALVIAAGPLALAAFMLTRAGSTRLIFGALAGAGVAALIAGAFVHELHDYERHLTVAGALLLAGAHVFRWRAHAPR